VHRQLKLYSEISQANAVRIDGEHDAIVALAPNMGQMIVDGIHSIIERNINESAEVAP
jgi:urease beta subunit